MWTLRNMHIHRDSLTILTVTELVESDALAQFEEFLHAQIKFNAELEKHSEKLIAEHLRRAKEAKVSLSPSLAERGRLLVYDLIFLRLGRYLNVLSI